METVRSSFIFGFLMKYRPHHVLGVSQNLLMIRVVWHVPLNHIVIPTVSLCARLQMVQTAMNLTRYTTTPLLHPITNITKT
jgi:hypothetical protein